MGNDPAPLIHREECLHIGISAVRQGRSKHICRDSFSGICIYDSCRVSRPVHLQDFSGFVVQMHCCTLFYSIVMVVLFEPRQLIRQFSFRLAFLTVFEPQQIECDAVFLQFPVDMLIVRHFVFRS